MKKKETPNLSGPKREPIAARVWLWILWRLRNTSWAVLTWAERRMERAPSLSRIETAQEAALESTAIREVNIYTSGWRATGNEVFVPQYEMTVRADWRTSDGEPHTATRTIQFPNLLQDIGAEKLKDTIWDLILMYALEKIESIQ